MSTNPALAVTPIRLARTPSHFVFESEDEVLEKAFQIMESRIVEKQSLTNSEEAQRYFQIRFYGSDIERFSVAFLDVQHRVNAVEDLSLGTIDQAQVYPREVVKAAIRHNASAVMLAHNHPSGNCQPSQADKAITQRLIDALALIDCRVLDHIVVGDQACFSFVQRGLI